MPTRWAIIVLISPWHSNHQLDRIPSKVQVHRLPVKGDNSMLGLYLFGPPRFERAQSPIHVSRRKGVALISYLACTGQPVGRETLATLLWPEHDQSAALRGLRRELARVKKELGKDSIAARQTQLALNVDAFDIVDVNRFQGSMQTVEEHGHFQETQCPPCLNGLKEAVKLYTDEFMAGFNLPDCPEYDAWQDFQRRSLNQQLASALDKLATWHVSHGEYTQAIAYGRQWLALDPLNEEARRTLMRFYAEAGQTAAALRLYEEGEQLLQEELGITPARESRQMYHSIRGGRRIFIGERDREIASPKVASAPQRARRTSLPRQPTSFIGRSRELTMIQLRMQEATCRLLTIVGPGGIGKTRLAIKVGRSISEEAVPPFADGVYFVPVGAVSRPKAIISAMMAAADVMLYGNEPRKQQFLDFLGDKQMLFILDNLEHLPGASEVISTILAAAPGVKILATSRVALRLQEEWFHPLTGLSVPPAGSSYWRPGEADDTLASLRHYDAVQLFEERARHASPAFSLGKDAEHVVRICRLVEGMPLALELAASWLKVLETREVADELEQSLDLLIARLENVSERHRSVPAVFNQTWLMLDSAEQRALARLSVFSGGFTREAAGRVAGADLFMLSGLVDKGLLYTTTRGRYRLHELMRQFAAGKLDEMGLVENVSVEHARHYMERLAQLAPDLQANRQLEAQEWVKNHLEDIRLAWQWALEQAALSPEAVESIFLYFYVRGRNQEGVEFLKSARERLAPRDGEVPRPIWGRITSRICLMKSFLAPAEDINEALQISLAIAERSGDRQEIAFCHFARGVFHTLIRDDETTAVEAFERARHLFRELQDSFYLVQVLIWLGFSHGNHSRLDEYFALNREALDLAREAGHHACAANALGNLVGGAFCVGDYMTAERFAHEVGAIGAALDLPNMITHSKTQLCLANFLKGDIVRAEVLAREAHALALEIQHPLSIGYTLTFRSLVANIRGDYEAGMRLARESLAIPVPQFGVIMAHWATAMASCGLGRYEAAWQHTLEMLEVAYSSGFVGLTIWSLPIMAILRAQAGEHESAALLLALAQTHPLAATGWQHVWPLLEEFRRRLKGDLGDDAFLSARERGRSLDLDQVIRAAFDHQAEGRRYWDSLTILQD